MSKKKRESDGIWVSDERRITDECRQVYPALYQLQRGVFIATAIVSAVAFCVAFFRLPYSKKTEFERNVDK